MVLSIKFVGGLRHFSGTENFFLAFESCGTVKELINKIIREFPGIKQSPLEGQLGDPTLGTLILVNNKEISVLNGLETSLKDGDEVVLVPFVHGG
jgi:molybdopterin synthase sulfur carrier subunit